MEKIVAKTQQDNILIFKKKKVKWYVYVKILKDPKWLMFYQQDKALKNMNIFVS